MKKINYTRTEIVVHLLGIVPLLLFSWQAFMNSADAEIMAGLVGDSGEMAIRWLLFTLAITPLNTLFRWRNLLRVRKAAGLYAFIYGLQHLILYMGEHQFGIGATWTAVFAEFRLWIGLIALVIMLPLALTSNRWSMRKMGKKWKRLHRVVYAVGILSVIHIILFSDEGVMYIVLLALLLILRIPQVRRQAASRWWRPRLQRPISSLKKFKANS